MALRGTGQIEDWRDLSSAMSASFKSIPVAPLACSALLLNPAPRPADP